MVSIDCSLANRLSHRNQPNNFRIALARVVFLAGIRTGYIHRSAGTIGTIVQLWRDRVEIVLWRNCVHLGNAYLLQYQNVLKGGILCSDFLVRESAVKIQIRIARLSRWSNQDEREIEYSKPS